MKLKIVHTTKILSFLTLLLVFLSFHNNYNASLIFDKQETRIAKQNIVGEGTKQVLVDQKALNKPYLEKITLAANSYTHWHSHPAGEIMIITEGEGVYV